MVTQLRKSARSGSQRLRPTRRRGREPSVALSFERKSFYSPVEIAEILGVSTQTVRDWIHSEALFAVRLSERIYRIPLGALMLKLGHAPRIRHEVRSSRASAEAADLRKLMAEHRTR